MTERKPSSSGDRSATPPVGFNLEHCDYKYRDESGDIVGVKQRRLNETEAGDVVTKKFRKGDRGIAVPFGLAEVKAGIASGMPVCIVDGERDAVTLRGLGCVATCAPYGMGSWNEAMVRHLDGSRTVYVFVDQDGGTGLRQARKLRDLLQRTIEPEKIILVRPAVGKDVYDHYVGDGGPWVWLEDEHQEEGGNGKEPAVKVLDEPLPAALQLMVSRLQEMPGVRLRRADDDPPRWRGHCPSPDHDDANASFAIGLGDTHPVITICSCEASIEDFAVLCEVPVSECFRPTDKDDRLEQTREQVRLRRRANRDVDEEEAAEAFAKPNGTFSGVEEMVIVDKPAKDRLNAVLKEHQIALLAASQKGGKSTLLKNLALDLIEGNFFLGRFAARSPTGRVGYWNYEEHEVQWRSEARTLGLDEVADRWAVEHLVGYPMYLETDVAAKYAVDWLGEREVEVWIIDILNRAFGGNWQNDNMATYRFFEKLEEIRRLSGVKEIIISAQSSVHAQDRVGGCAALDASPSVLWTLTRQGDTRFFSAYGRGGINVKEQDYSFDAETLRLGSGGGQDQRKHKASSLVVQVLQIVKAYPGINKTDLKGRMSGGRNQDFNTAIADAVLDGFVRTVPEGKSHLHFLTDDGEEHLRLLR